MHVNDGVSLGVFDEEDFLEQLSSGNLRDAGDILTTLDDLSKKALKVIAVLLGAAPGPDSEFKDDYPFRLAAIRWNNHRPDKTNKMRRNERLIALHVEHLVENGHSVQAAVKQLADQRKVSKSTVLRYRSRHKKFVNSWKPIKTPIFLA